MNVICNQKRGICVRNLIIDETRLETHLDARKAYIGGPFVAGAGLIIS